MTHGPGRRRRRWASIRLDVKGTTPEDVLIKSSGTDIRCRAAAVSAGCGSANTDNASLTDYAGELNGVAQIRITDHFNGAIGAGGGTEAATANDLPFSVPAVCANTADTAVGGTCTANTSANGGADGAAATDTDNPLFGTQGIWIAGVSP